ncbi:MAG: RNA 2'-phosphotransferase [Bacilli bacterium]|nr:RNA 2'-phosphotransferase [Bacilli bacterium]
MTSNYMIELGMFIAKILRHDPESIGIIIDEHGWAKVSELIDGVIASGYDNFNLAQLKELVKTDNKQRYSFNEDYTLIRANQGHSIKVDVELYRLTEEDVNEIMVLYHGTTSRNVKSINKRGLLKMGRNFVQLSNNQQTAETVGNRHNRKLPGTLVIYVIDIKKLFDDGYDIYRSINGVYLIDHVPSKYFIKTIEY